MLIIGSHVGYKKDSGLVGSVKEALSYNANTIMVYTGAPQNTKRHPIDLEKVKEADQLMKDNKISKDTNKMYKKTIIIVLAIIISFFLAIIIISRIMMVLPKGVIIWIYIIMAISTACVADITLAYKKNKR